MERVRDAAALLVPSSLGPEIKARWASRLVDAVDHAPQRRAMRANRRWSLLLAGSTTLALAAFLAGRLPKHRTQEANANAPGRAVAVHAKGAVAFARVRPAPDELLRLDDGTLRLVVPPLGPGHRVRVAVADTEVELTAGQFEITAAARQLAAVRVWYGHTVISGARFKVQLNDGDQWTRSGDAEGEERRNAPAGTPPPPRADTSTVKLAADPAVREASRPTSRSTRRSVSGPQLQAMTDLPSIAPTVPPAAATPAQRESFDRGWRLLRAGEAGQAASAFAEVSSEPQGGAIREDALFWRGVAFARAAVPSEARATLAQFVRTYPLSPRRGEAAAMLGWLYLDAHDEPAARAAFELAQNDRSSRVRASALCGLSRLAGQPCPNGR